MRRSFFTKALVTVGVVASSLVLSSMAVFAANITSNYTADTLSKTGATISSDYKYTGTNSGSYDSENKKATYSWDFSSGIDDSAVQSIYGLEYKSLQNNTSAAKLSSDGGYIKFTTDGKFDVSLTSAKDKSAAALNLGDTVDTKKKATGWDSISATAATATNQAAGTYYIYRGNDSNANLSTLTITVYNAASTSCKVNAPTGYAGDFTLSVEAEKDINALVADDTVTVSYSGNDYVIDEFVYTVTADDVTKGSKTLTVPEGYAHPITYTVTGTYSGIDSLSGTLTVGGTAATVSGSTYSVEGLSYSDSVNVAYSESNYTVTPSTITLSGTPNASYVTTVEADLTFASASSISDSFSMAFTKDVNKGDLGNGVYAIDNLKYSGNSAFVGLSGYITNSSNPKDAAGIFGSDIGIPVEGCALAFKTGNVNGKMTVFTYGNKGKSVYIRKVDSSNNVTKTNSYYTFSENNGLYQPISFTVDANSTYYFFGQNTKLRYYGVKFVAADDKVSKNITTVSDNTITSDPALPSPVVAYSYNAAGDYILVGLNNEHLAYDSITIDDSVTINSAYKSIQFAEGDIVTASNLNSDAIFVVELDSVPSAVQSIGGTWTFGMEE